MKSIYTTKNYKVLTLTIAEADKMINLGALPAMQAARGQVWPATVKTQLVTDAAAGLYIPPIVLVGDKDSNALSDGQQRLSTLVAAYTAGKLPGDTVILLAVDLARTVEESFSRLNVGVPVGTALVAAMSCPAPTLDGILRLTAHPYLQTGRKWSDAQTKKTTTADFAAAALAIASGWRNPESSTRECTRYLGGYTATEDVIQRAYDALTALHGAIEIYNEGSKVKGDLGKKHRAVLAETRKKSIYMTLIAVILADPASAPIALRSIAHADKYLVPVKVAGIGVCKWAIGGGTSGGAADYRERYQVMVAALARVRKDDADAIKPAAPVQSAADKATLDASAADADTIMDALFSEPAKDGATA